VIAYSADAEQARAYLLRAYNDVDIFVEDTTGQNMYVRLFNRMLEAKGKRINHVFPLHSRKNVVEHCRNDHNPSGRPRLYIIDADQDLILGRPAPRLKNLYRLKVYCSENLLLSEYAIVTIATECDTNTPWPEMATALSIQTLLPRVVGMLLPLFIAYAVVHKLDLNIETVRFPVQRLLADPNDERSLSEQIIRSRVLSVLRSIRSQVPRHKYRRARNSIVSRLIRRALDNSIYISGKTYLLPLMQIQLRRAVNFRDSLDCLKVRLAQHCELTIDAGLQHAVLKALKSQ